MMHVAEIPLGPVAPRDFERLVGAPSKVTLELPGLKISLAGRVRGIRTEREFHIGPRSLVNLEDPSFLRIDGSSVEFQRTYDLGDRRKDYGVDPERLSAIKDLVAMERNARSPTAPALVAACDYLLNIIERAEA
jgi:hypothetical protein